MPEIARTYVIAEAGVNHNGSLEMAMKLIDAAVEAGADAVKFQTFKASELASKSAPKARYQTQTTGSGESQFEMLKKLELTEEMHRQLIAHCRARKIEFLSTPFDFESLQLLAQTFDLARLKLPSGEITNLPFLVAAAQTGKPIILSTGMSTLDEVETALGALACGYLNKLDRPSSDVFKAVLEAPATTALLAAKVVLLQCTTEYPAPFADVNLRAIDTMKQVFTVPVGLSDHTPGIAVPIAAVARGAVVIEKHFTLDRGLPGPDHQASLLPPELKDMIRSIREVELALGSPIKQPAPSELRNRDVARKSLYARRAIARGKVIDEADIAIKRPGTGISPAHYWEWIGRCAERDYPEDSPLL